MENGHKSSATTKILDKVLELLDSEGVFGTDRDQPVVVFKHPKELTTEIPDLDLEAPITDEKQLWDVVRRIIQHCVKTSHPYFLNQLYGGLDPYGLAGAWISEALNTNQYTYEVAPAFTLAELAVLKRVLNLVGFQNGDGIFAPGGSIANMFAIALARYKMDPTTKNKGISHLPPLVMLTSEESHYSMLKAAHWFGVGTDNVIRVKTDERGRMIPSALVESIESALSAGKKPFFVNATAGTTVLGAFDPLAQIADVCEKYQLWMHVDACWGGSLMFSDKYSAILKDTHRADSLAWNPHKMLGAPLQCSILVIKEKGLLHQCNSAAATYLFQQDKFYDTAFDTGDKSVQCGRKVDAFKLWLMWSVRGQTGFARLVDNCMDVSRYFMSRIKEMEGFILVLPEFQCTNICFWYIPPSLRSATERNQEWWSKVSEVAPKIKERMIMAGSLMIGYQPLKHRNLPNFFRLVTTCHPPPTTADMEHVIKEIVEKGADL